MALRHPIRRDKAVPTLWLMTDERMGERLWSALSALPRGSGVAFRHFATAEPARTALFGRIARIARRRGLVLVEAGAARQPVGLHTVHSAREARVARRSGADLVLVSPVHPTRTHAGARPLGAIRAARIAAIAGIPAIALGGMTARRYRRMRALGFVGWAAIDGLTPQKRNAVPT